MNNQDFTRVIKQQIDRCKAILCSKGDEYSTTTTDRLSNFKTCAALQHLSQAQALSGQLAKHLVSIQTLIWERPSVTVTSEDTWNEKITDAINYLILLRAVVEEELGCE